MTRHTCRGWKKPSILGENSKKKPIKSLKPLKNLNPLKPKNPKNLKNPNATILVKAVNPFRRRAQIKKDKDSNIYRYKKANTLASMI